MDNMKWLEVSVTVEDEVAEAVADTLTRFAPNGVAVVPPHPAGGTWESEPDAEPLPAPRVVTVKAYLPVDDRLPEARRRVEEALWHLGQIRPIPEPTFQPIAESDWSQAWKEHFHVLRVGRRIVIKPTWREYTLQSGDLVIELDPGMAFGTGLHPSTRLCLQAIEERLRPGQTVLDLGTGSGILAIAAARLGAAEVLGLDNDPVAVRVAGSNVRGNGVQEQIQVRTGTLSDVGGAFDLVVVNILARVIVHMAGQGLAATVRPGGLLLAAGLIAEQEQEVAQALTRSGLTVVDRRQEEDWVLLAATRS